MRRSTLLCLPLLSNPLLDSDLIVAAWIAPSIFNIGDESFTSVFLLFAMVFGSVLVRPGAAISWFHCLLKQADLRNYVNIANVTGYFCSGIRFSAWDHPYHW